MTKPLISDTLARIAQPIAHAMGLEIWGIEVLQAGRAIVRIYIDKPVRTDVTPNDIEDSATIAQCAKVSRMVGLALDVEDAFPSAYVLEVSSPGLSRTFFTLDQTRPYVGDCIDVVLHEASAPQWPGRKKFRGTLLEVTETDLRINIEASAENITVQEDSVLHIAWDALRKAARAHVFTMPQKPGQKKRSVKPNTAQTSVEAV